MKKTWNKPQLTVHGNVETLTQQSVKEVGGFDGTVLQIGQVTIGITDV